MPEATIKIDSDNVLAREVEGEIVILDIKSQHYIGGNPTVTALWPLLEQGTTREDLCETLCERFGIERSRAEADVDPFLASLEEFGLLAEPA